MRPVSGLYRSITLFLLALLVVSATTLAQAPTSVAQPPATILIIRHAEKLTDGQLDLSPPASNAPACCRTSSSRQEPGWIYPRPR